ncbi:MAG: phosphodiesterase, partial [Magnetococcales bacterium]|nr:phosphodiesterase [Magnetococcales bacterium]
MLIAHITDCHVVEKGQLCYGQVATNRQLRDAINHITSMVPKPNVVLVTGDLTDHGSIAEYEEVRSLLSRLEQPTYLIPGNHDHRERFLQAFKGSDYLPKPGSPFAHYAVDDHPLRLIGLDTLVHGERHGALCAQRLQWLDATLSEKPDQPTVLFMHHPPCRTWMHNMDKQGLLEGMNAFHHILKQHDQIAWVACGHVHRSVQMFCSGKPVFATPSTCHQ